MQVKAAPFARDVIGDPGVCVYCGQAEGLSEEHVVPFGLNGPWILDNASCPSCARITSAFEQEVLRNQLLMARTALGLKTRRKKQRPKLFELHVRERGIVKVPITEHQPMIYLPIYAPPSEYERRLPSPGIVVRPVVRFTLVGGMNLTDLDRKYGRDNWGFRTDFDALALPRMIGKIAYCFAVARLGVGNFDSPLCAAALKYPNEIGRWVGCLDAAPVNGTANLHEVSLARSGDEVHAFVRLFAQFAAPEYFVIVGRLNEHGRALCLSGVDDKTGHQRQAGW